MKNNYKKIQLGTVNNESIFLSPPSWDCGWYWGFGYLGNDNCHYHLSGLSKDCNLYDGIKNHFGNSFIITDDEDIWTFAELIQTFYNLQEASEVFRRGGSNYTNNPCKDIIINKEIVTRINNIIIPAIFEEIYKILNKYTNKNIMTTINLEKHIWEGWRVIDFINDLEPTLDNIMKNYFGKSIIKNKADLKKWCMSNQPYYKKYIPEVVNYFVEKYKIK